MCPVTKPMEKKKNKQKAIKPHYPIIRNQKRLLQKKSNETKIVAGPRRKETALLYDRPGTSSETDTLVLGTRDALQRRLLPAPREQTQGILVVRLYLHSMFGKYLNPPK